MASGGVRINAGRKKVGVVINTRIDEDIINQLEIDIKGNSRADKIRKCLLLGLEKNNEIQKEKHYNNNSTTISRFFKTYKYIVSVISKNQDIGIKKANQYLLGFFTSNIPSKSETCVNESTHALVIKELSKYEWSLSENIANSNCVTPSIVGSVIEKIVNQKDTGSYYTPKDTTNYISKYSIVFSIISACNSLDLTNEFYSLYNDSNDTAVFNSNNDPVETLSIAINKLSDFEKNNVFKKICNITILDPTCGTGAFIIEAAEIMVTIYKLTNMYMYISLNDFAINLFTNCLFGVDIEKYAISLIHLRSKLYLYNLGISKSIVETISFQFYRGDSLFKKSSFSWEKNFDSIIKKGGFDCLIGNPPYVEVSKSNYKLDDFKNYQTKQCGNLYAYVLEKSMDLLKPNGYMGMIVPISVISTPRMQTLRETLMNNSIRLFFANFSDRPSCLFSGVHQKLTILFAKKSHTSSSCNVYTSTYIHWNKFERQDLFETVKYYRTSKAFINENEIAKLGDDIKAGILKKISKQPYEFYDLITTDSNVSNNIFLNQRITFWTKCFTAPEKSSEYRTYTINEKYDNKAIAAFLNSSLFFLLWETYSDCWHITKKDLEKVKFGDLFLDSKTQIELSKLELLLEKALKNNREYIYSKQTDYIYVHRKCIKEISEIDEYIAELFNLSDIEKKYISEYNIKYRLSQDFLPEEL